MPLNENISVEDLGGGFKAAVSPEHRFGIDAFLLAAFSSPKHKDRVCDLCAGGGIVGLLMLRDHAPVSVTSVEIQESAYRLSLMSKELSGAENYFPQNADLVGWRGENQFDLITCNPPYKKEGTGIMPSQDSGALIRCETACRIEDVCLTAKRNLKYGGRLCICNRPERLADCVSAMRAAGIEPKRLRTVHKNAGADAWLILLEGRLGGSGFLKIEKPFLVYGPDGEYSEETAALYGMYKRGEQNGI